MRKNKTALITGITGQDGSYLAELLLEKGYRVYGLVRRSSLPNTERIKHLCSGDRPKIELINGDLTDAESIFRAVKEIQPDEIYNLGAQSHVAVSFDEPEYTANVDALGTLRFLEAIRMHGLSRKTRFYQASTSELFGKVREIPQTEQTPFYPRSPYGVAKIYGYWIVVNYRESYGIFACNGTLFNHESPLRGEEFVTRKITRTLTRVCLGLEDCLYLGNLNAKRDWGHAKDYVRAMWLILQQKKPEDFVIATGRQHSVREFVEITAGKLGVLIQWRGKEINEEGIVKGFVKSTVDGGAFKRRLKKGRAIVKINPSFYRPADVDTLLGNPAKAKRVLKWRPEHDFESLVGDMVKSDFRLALKEYKEVGLS